MTGLVFENIGTLVTNDPQLGEGPLGLLHDAALVVEGEVVVWAGPGAAVPEGAATDRVDVAGAAVLPGFVDSHAHLVFAGDRTEEFAARMAGRPYTAGGIATTDSDTGRVHRGIAAHHRSPRRRGASLGHDHDRVQVRLRADRR